MGPEACLQPPSVITNSLTDRSFTRCIRMILSVLVPRFAYYEYANIHIVTFFRHGLFRRCIGRILRV